MSFGSLLILIVIRVITETHFMQVPLLNLENREVVKLLSNDYKTNILGNSN